MGVYRGTFDGYAKYVRFDRNDDTHPAAFKDDQKVVVMSLENYQDMVARLERMDVETIGGPEPLPLEKKPEYEEDV